VPSALTFLFSDPHCPKHSPVLNASVHSHTWLCLLFFPFFPKLSQLFFFPLLWLLTALILYSPENSPLPPFFQELPQPHLPPLITPCTYLFSCNSSLHNHNQTCNHSKSSKITINSKITEPSYCRHLPLLITDATTTSPALSAALSPCSTPPSPCSLPSPLINPSPCPAITDHSLILAASLSSPTPRPLGTHRRRPLPSPPMQRSSSRLPKHSSKFQPEAPNSLHPDRTAPNSHRFSLLLCRRFCTDRAASADPHHG
jgi:hypothetical protein